MSEAYSSEGPTAVDDSTIRVLCLTCVVEILVSLSVSAVVEEVEEEVEVLIEVLVSLIRFAPELINFVRKC